MSEIDFGRIERKWQKKWEKEKIFLASESSKKEKFYFLEMFPYPSGSGLHMGHALNYTIGDVFSRFKRMKGYNLLHPMGYDALGLPAENAAIKEERHPEEYTKNSIKNFSSQLKSLGFSYDWSRTINTSSPNYYKWDQWIFLKMFERGLAYQKESAVNWCPDCKTVLANEQVNNGKCWRHDKTSVEVKFLKQWFLKITDYAEELLDKLHELDWPEKTKSMQKHWIGKSYGAEIYFEIFKEMKFASYLLIEKSFNLNLEKELLNFGKFKIEEKDKDWGKFFRVKIPLEKEKEFIDFVKKNILVKNENGGSWYVDSVGTTNKVIFKNKVIDLNNPGGKKEFFEYGKKFGIPEEQLDIQIPDKKWPIFTTRPDTIFGVTFLVISPYHPKLKELIIDSQKKEVEKFIEKLKSVSEKDLADLEKEGVFTGSYATNPLTNEKVPIYVGNFVIAEYGGGMVMGVPAHDKRDFYFAKKYGIAFKVVIDPIDFEISEKNLTEAFVGEGTLINSGVFNGLKSSEAKEKIVNYLIKKGFGKRAIKFRLKDWGISRQRYWGTPIPIIYCEQCGTVPVPEKDLPVKLPKEVKFGKGNPLETNEKWIRVACPKCGKIGKRETDTMDTFVNSSWYFLRYADPKNNNKIFETEKVDYWNPVDIYVGGAEHACMHLIYSRFYIKFLRDLGILNFDEPIKRLFHQGMLHAEDGDKMSKSKGNVVNPLEVSKKYGVDSLRFFLISVASPDKDFNWSEKGIQGSYKFLKKVYNFFQNVKVGKDGKEIGDKLNSSIEKVGEYIESFKYRKASIKIRELFEILFKEEKVKKEILEDSLKLLAPFCPHLCEELWEGLGNKRMISITNWPKYVKVNLKKKEEEDLNQKIIKRVFSLVSNFEKRGSKIKKVYLYVLPFEFEKIDVSKLKREIGKEIFVYSVKDKKKCDPENKSKKAKPGMPGIWFE